MPTDHYSARVEGCALDWTSPRARFVPLVLASMLHKIEWKLPQGMVPKDVDLSDHCTLVLRLAKPLLAVPLLSSTT